MCVSHQFIIVHGQHSSVWSLSATTQMLTMCLLTVSRAGMAVNFRSLTCGPAAPGVPGSPLAPLPPGAPCKMQRNTVKRVFQCKRTETLTEVKSSYLRSRRASPPIWSLNNNKDTQPTTFLLNWLTAANANVSCIA